jgi:uncharacterized membrane protein SpoIIM required for sporulation
MTDKLMGLFLLVFVFAVVAMGSFAVYAIYGVTPQRSDTFGDQFGNKTNSTIAVEQAVAPISIQLNGYIPLLVMALIVFSTVLGLGMFVIKGGGGPGVRR